MTRKNYPMKALMILQLQIT